MSKPWLSILLPSIREEGREAFLSSLVDNTTDLGSIEIVLTHDIGAVPQLVGELAKAANADWVFLANDDLRCATKGWDDQFKILTTVFPDGVALFWPNDNMFNDRLSCFPMLRKDILELYFPTPYLKYKLDDEIYHTFPFNRRFYMKDINFPHLNDDGKPGEGYILPDGRIYKIDYTAGEQDEVQWNLREERRQEIRDELLSRMQ